MADINQPDVNEAGKNPQQPQPGREFQKRPTERKPEVTDPTEGQNEEINDIEEDSDLGNEAH